MCEVSCASSCPRAVTSLDITAHFHAYSAAGQWEEEEAGAVLKPKNPSVRVVPVIWPALMNCCSISVSRVCFPH